MNVFVELDENNFIISYSTCDMTGSMIATDIDEDDERLKSCFSYKYIDSELVLDESKRLKDVIAFKLNELNNECSERIYEGFDYEGYHFPFDAQDQLNFTSTFLLMSTGALDEIGWTCYDSVGKVHRMKLTAEDFTKLSVMATKHKDGLITIFREVIQPRLEQLTDINEVANSTWDSLLEMEVKN